MNLAYFYPLSPLIQSYLAISTYQPTYDTVRKYISHLIRPCTTRHLPTHVHGNTLDHIFSPKTNKIVTDHSIGTLYSDHFLIFLILSHPKPTRTLTTRISCKFHNLPIPAIICDLSSLPTSTSAELHTSLSSTLDKYAPYSLKPPSHALIYPGILYPY